MQIEKFAETIFPSQSAEEAQRRLTGAVTEEEARKAKEEAEARQDVYFIMGLMGVVVLIVALTMVSLNASVIANMRLTVQRLDLPGTWAHALISPGRS